jgi:glycosyltransferase involved in cell wall biosynthesis
MTANAASRICLNMIVKDEAKVIVRCLESVKPILDSWVIVDTGSTDGTQEIVRSFLKDLPGELYERRWRDFGYNRTEAIELARKHTKPGDYLLVIDADDRIEIPPDFTLPELTKDAYEILVEDAGTSYVRLHLFRADLDFRYVGVLHAVLHAPAGSTRGRLTGIVQRRTGGGARSANPDKFRHDAAVLEKALAEEPTNARYAFYLAQSWRDAGEHEKALRAYEHRVAMGGWEEEVYFSLHEIGRLGARLGLGHGVVIDSYLRAHELRPSRAEPLCNLAGYLRGLGRHVAAYPFARVAAEIPRPDDILFVDDSVYAWRAIDELAIASYWTGRYEDGRGLNERLLAEGRLPPDERPRIEKNLAFCRDKLAVVRSK